MADQLCCRMESCANIAAPEWGVGGACVGAPTFLAGRFNLGMRADAGKYCTFPTAGNSINIDKGAIELWVKPKFAFNEAGNKYIWSFISGVPDCGINLWYQGTLQAWRVQVYVGGIQQTWLVSSGQSFAIDTLIHLAVAWDRLGADIGGGKTVALYIDNVEDVSSVTGWNSCSVNANLYVGCDDGGGNNGKSVLDNVKTYDHVKTNYADKDTEGCITNQPPTAPTSPQVDGKDVPTGWGNCVSKTPQFTAIFNDPDPGDTSNAIQIQVGTAPGLSDMWDSGWLADTTVDGNRCTPKTYAGAALSGANSYWWRSRFRDVGNLEGAWSGWSQFDVCADPPNAPTNLHCRDLTDPLNVVTPIYFSATFTDPNPGGQPKGSDYRVQVSDRPSFDDPIWDTLRRSMPWINSGGRCDNINYGGPSLERNRRYYWRVKFWNSWNREGPWGQ